jgi:hypothetical protein
MFAYDIRRFTPKQRSAYDWAVERSHEAYAKNYSIVFPFDQPLAGRNLIQDPFHKVNKISCNYIINVISVSFNNPQILVNSGAVMEEKAGEYQ